MCVEVVLIPNCHYSDIVDDELVIDAVMLHGGDDLWYIMVGIGVVVAKELHCIGYTEIIVEKAQEDRVCLLGA